MDRVSSTTGKIYWIWASFLGFGQVISEAALQFLYRLQKWNWAEKSIISSPLKVGHTAPPAATCPASYNAHRRQVSRTMAWRRVSLHSPISFGSKTQPTLAPRLVTWAARNHEWGVQLMSVPLPMGQTSPRYTQLFPSLPIRALSCPSLPFDGFTPLGHMRSIGHAFGNFYLFGPLVVPDALMRVTTSPILVQLSPKHA